MLNPPFDMVYSNPESVIGEWNVAMNTWEGNAERVLNITRQEDKLGAVFTDTKSSDLKISNVEYRDETLSFCIAFPEPDEYSREVWLKITGSEFKMVV